MALLFYKVKQLGSRLVPGWVTAVLDFVEDLVSHYRTLLTKLAGLGGSVGYAHQTSDQDIAGSSPVGSATFFHGD